MKEALEVNRGQTEKVQEDLGTRVSSIEDQIQEADLKLSSDSELAGKDRTDIRGYEFAGAGEIDQFQSLADRLKNAESILIRQEKRLLENRNRLQTLIGNRQSVSAADQAQWSVALLSAGDDPEAKSLSMQTFRKSAPSPLKARSAATSG